MEEIDIKIQSVLDRLSKSKFRASFHLKKDDIEYIKTKGWEKIRSHCFDIISKRLAPALISNDGRQTPTHGHPVFVAQHACACCCRGCLNKWHKIKPDVALSSEEIKEIVKLLLTWLQKEFYNFRDKKIIIKRIQKNKPIQLKLFN